MTIRRAALLSVAFANFTAILAAQDTAAPDLREQLRATARGNIITLPVRLGSLPSLAFVLDSGASSVILNERLVRQHGLAMGEARVSSGAGSDSCRVHLFPESGVSVAGVHLQTQPIVAPLQHLETFVDTQINGIVGGELFRKHAVAMDFNLHKASVLDEPVDASPTDGVIPLQSSGSLCCILEAKVRIGNLSTRGRFLLDTGALAFEVVLSRAFAQRAGFLPDAIADPIRLPTFCAESSIVHVSKHGEVLLMRGNETGLTAAGVVVFAALDQEGSLSGRDFDGVIGSEMIRKLGKIVIFDAPHHRLLLRKAN